MKSSKSSVGNAIRGLRFVNDPGFIVIGAQKCGTSSLHYYLDQHRGLVGSNPKEIHFFDRDIYFGQTVEDYRRNFRGSRAKLHFETSPSYLYTPGSAFNIWAQYPDIKMIVILREPIERAYSAWNHYKQLFESGEFRESIQKNPKRPGNLLFDMLFKGRDAFPSFGECVELELGLIERSDGFEPALLRRGLYLEQLERYWRYFEQPQILILGFKDLVTDTVATLNRVCDFLGVNPMDINSIDLEPRHNREYGAPVSEEDRRILEEFYAEPNRQLLERNGAVNW